MGDMPKRVKRALREVARRAHEEELRRALLPLAEAVDQWRAGKMSSAELVDLIHHFQQGATRELFKKYHDGLLNLAVAHAIVIGVIDRGQVPGELLHHLRRAIEFSEEAARSSYPAPPECPSEQTGSMPMKENPPYTTKPGQYLAFIHYSTKIHRRAPAETDLQRYFGASPAAVHQMLLSLEAKGFIERVHGKARAIWVMLPRQALPALQ